MTRINHHCILLRIREYRLHIMRDIEIQVTRTFLAGRDGNSKEVFFTMLSDVLIGQQGRRLFTVCCAMRLRTYFTLTILRRRKLKLCPLSIWDLIHSVKLFVLFINAVIFFSLLTYCVVSFRRKKVEMKTFENRFWKERKNFDWYHN